MRKPTGGRFGKPANLLKAVEALRRQGTATTLTKAPERYELPDGVKLRRPGVITVKIVKK